MMIGATQSAGNPGGPPSARHLAREIEVLAFGDDERDAARNAHHAERGDEGRQLDRDDQRSALSAPAADADQQRASAWPARGPSRHSRTDTPQTTLASAMIDPGARSIPPEMMTIAAPTAAMP